MDFGSANVVISNSVVCSDHDIVNDNVVSGGLVRISSEAMMLDARGVPAKGSPLVDWASGRVETSYDVYVDRTDPFDVPRVLNDGRQDLGGAEHDWRIDYGSDLCHGRITVTDVSPLAKELPDGRVSLPVGEMTLDWSADKTRFLEAQVTGNGTLALYRDGDAEPIHTWENGTASMYRIRDAVAASANFRFVYTPGDNDAGGAVLGPFSGSLGLLMVRQVKLG